MASGMEQLAPLPVVGPLLVAALLAGCSKFLPRVVMDGVGILAAAGVCAVSAVLAWWTQGHGPLVYWFGGWAPDGAHFPIGIGFVVDPVSAGMSAFVGLLVLLAMVFAWRYFKAVKTLFHVMMMVFMAAMSGLCLTGDLFNLFVWFELMTAAAVALCGYKSQESGPLQGALNFAVTNTVGAFLTLTGIAFLYAMTGSLNFAGIAEALRTHPPEKAFLGLAFMFVATGFLVKAAAFPFHFWLADAHAVAPTPVCVLFSGVMVELGIYAIARLWVGVFSPAMEPWEGAVRGVLVTVGTATAVVGALECFMQHHLKRLLAFSTVSHAGLMLVGLGTLEAAGMGGVMMYVVFHGLIKAALFVCAGILLHRFGSLDERELHGRGKEIWTVGVMMVVGGLGLMAMPPFGTFLAEGWMDHGLTERGLEWEKWVFVGAGAVTAAAVVRFALRVFFGVGVEAKEAAETPKEEMRETQGGVGRVPWNLWMPAAGALLMAMGLGWVAGGAEVVGGWIEAWRGTHLYLEKVLGMGGFGGVGGGPRVELEWLPAVVAAGVAGMLVWGALARATAQGVRGVLKLWMPVHRFQSGRVTDYVAWQVAGVAAWGGMLLWWMG